MPGDVHVRGSLVIPESELSWRFSRSGGPGGQSVNTADSRVELSWDLARSTALGPTLKDRALQRLANRLVDGVLTVTASEHRSQFANRRAAEARLGATVAEAIAPPPVAG
jgi:ribosome-associated protein